MIQYCSKTTKPVVQILSPHDSPIILVLRTSRRCEILTELAYSNPREFLK